MKDPFVEGAKAAANLGLNAAQAAKDSDIDPSKFQLLYGPPPEIEEIDEPVEDLYGPPPEIAELIEGLYGPPPETDDDIECLYGPPPEEDEPIADLYGPPTFFRR